MMPPKDDPRSERERVIDQPFDVSCALIRLLSDHDLREAFKKAKQSGWDAALDAAAKKARDMVSSEFSDGDVIADEILALKGDRNERIRADKNAEEKES